MTTTLMLALLSASVGLALGRFLRRRSAPSRIGPPEEVSAELARLRARLRDTQRIAQLASWEWDVSGDAMWWSDQAREILGPGACASATLDEALACVLLADRQRVGLAFERARTQGIPFAVSYRVTAGPGGERSVHQRGEAVRDGSGQVVRLSGTLQDVTEARRAEQRLAVLSRAVEQSENDVFITDSEWHILYANPAFERHTGWSLPEIEGRKPEEVLRSGRMPREFFSEMHATLGKGHPFRGVFVNRRRDGSHYHEEQTIAPIRDESGRITHYLATGRDITEERRHQAMERNLRDALQHAAEEWRETFDAVDAGVLVLDAELQVVRLNRAARDLLGRSFQATVGKPLPSDSPEPFVTVVQLAREVSREGTPAESRASDETGRVWEVALSPRRAETGSPPGAIALVRDVSDAERLQESLRRAEQMSAMGALVAGVAHEVRNPLFAISASLDAFDSELGDREDFREYSTLLRTEVRRLSELMKELLEYGRPSAPELALHPLRDSIEGGVRACEHQAAAARVSLRTEIGIDDAPMQIDAPRLIQAVQNVVQNAIDHSPEGGCVRVSAREIDGAVEVRVEDEGPGFGETLDRVFDPFFTRRRAGTGLGLSIVKRIVEEHGGEVTPSDRADGRGGVMTIRLPRQPREVKA